MLRLLDLPCVLAGLLASLIGFDATADPPTGMVAVEGGAVEVSTRGEGGPTVVFESGAGGSAADGAAVQRSVASFARTVAYSRRGLGRSTPTSLPRTARQIATELRDVLRRARIEPPYVLVAHSAGGFHARTFAALYPDEVAGLVLVDAAHERLRVEIESRLAVTPEQRAWMDASLAEQRDQAPPGLQAEDRELEAIHGAGRLADAERLPDVPLAVVTSTRAFPEVPHPVGSPAGRQVWRELHAGWVKQAARGRHWVTDRSGHFVQAEEPEIVVEAIRWVGNQARLP